MPDSTNNHGGSWDLTIPAGDDSVDIVRDVGTLGVEVDVALSEAFVGGFNADSGDGDYSGATAPLSLYGTSRPDAAGDDITAPTGSTYTFSGDQTQLDAVFGARRWTKGVTDWVCVEGDTQWWGIGTSSSTYHGQRLIANGLVWEYMVRSSGSFLGGAGFSRDKVFVGPTYYPAAVPGATMPNADSGTNKAATTVTTAHLFFSEAFVGINNGIYWVVATGAGTTSGGNCSNSTYVSTKAHGQWPTSGGAGSGPAPRLIAELWDGAITQEEAIEGLKAEIKQAAKDDPELAEQLRQELEALQAEAGE